MIIGLTGECGAGKTTLAGYLNRYRHYKVMSFAGPFKQAMCCLFLWDHTKMNEQEYKNGIDAITGRPRRELMNEFATDYIREKIDPIFHTKALAIQLLQHYTHDIPFPVVFDDVRHPDEVELITHIGGVIVKVDRPENTFVQPDHISEKYNIPYSEKVINLENDKSYMYKSLLYNFDIPKATDRKGMLMHTKDTTRLILEYIDSYIRRRPNG